MRRYLHWGGLLVIILPFLAGCSGMSMQGPRYYRAVASGNMVQAGELATKIADTSPKRNKVLWRLEAGNAWRCADQPVESLEQFEQAESLISDFESGSDISVTTEAGAALTSQSLLPYQGTSYDRIMMNTYKALCYLMTGNDDAARVELRRAYERQREAVEDHSKRIEKAQQKAEENQTVDIDRTMSDESFQATLQSQYTNLEQFKPYGDYAVPYAEFLQGLFYTYCSLDSSDQERGAKSMSRALGMCPNNAYLKEDLRLSEEATGGKKAEDLTYIIFETGLAPVRRSVRIDLPIFLLGQKSGGIDYVGAAFPALKPVDDYASHLVVQAGGESVQTSLLCDMDSVVLAEFKSQMPAMIARTVASTLIKAGAAYAVSESTKKNRLTNSIMRLGTTLYQAVMNQADERSWRTLPKEVQYCRIKTPADGRLMLQVAGRQAVPVTLAETDGIQVVLVRSISASSPLITTQLSLH